MKEIDVSELQLLEELGTGNFGVRYKRFDCLVCQNSNLFTALKVPELLNRKCPSGNTLVHLSASYTDTERPNTVPCNKQQQSWIKPGRHCVTCCIHCFCFNLCCYLIDQELISHLYASFCSCSWGNHSSTCSKGS